MNLKGYHSMNFTYQKEDYGVNIFYAIKTLQMGQMSLRIGIPFRKVSVKRI